MTHERPVPPDQRERDAAIGERDRNTVVDAGAGTGKTTLLVSRLVGMVAPDDPDSEPVPLERIAAVTFTRRAAGDLRLRIRERLLKKLADPATTPKQGEALRRALGALDTAFVGTIHSFADRLLRMHPREAKLSPAYEIAEDTELLERETYERLLRGAETGELRAQLAAKVRAGDLDEDRVREAEQTVLLALEAGLRAEDEVHEHYTKLGIQGLVGALVGQRDVVHADVPRVACDIERFRRYAREYIDRVGELDDDSLGVRRMRAVARRLRELMAEDDPARLYREVSYAVDRYLEQPKMRQKEEFEKDRKAIDVWKAYDKGDGRERPLREDLLGPLRRWIAHRLARLRPVVVALYDQVKQRHRVLDQVDLLLQLRDLLRDDKTARRDYQQRFDHVLVDEFQDTDPLQAEIIAYLCEAEPVADDWKDIALAPGKLTIVGDPKQSIYRFRRADIAMYDEARRLILGQGALETEIRANFRSTRPLIEWLNHRFADVLGEPPAPGVAFDPDHGEVYQRPLEPGPFAGDEDRPSVHAVSFDSTDLKAPQARKREAEVLPCYLRWLVKRSGFEVTDPVTFERRPVRYGDIAVLAVSTMSLPLLFPKLDDLDVPYAARGGTLFLQDPLHRQFLLGLRALADRNDGIAEAALLRPPFFALDVRDLALERAARRELLDGSREEIDRVREARAHVSELRRRRFERSPGETARELLERTAFARTVAAGPNGAQRLARLRELCLVVEQRAAERGFDFDAVTAELREWADSPVQLDPPHPVGAEAVRIMTVHQAKGLEFPVVLLWDHRGQWSAGGEGNVAWRVDRHGRGWMIGLSGLAWEEPPELGLKDREKSYRDAERKRVAYVAATRARDLLALPYGGEAPAKWICGRLLADDPDGHVTWLPTYGDDTVEAEQRWWEPPAEGQTRGRLDTPPAEGESSPAEGGTRGRLDTSPAEGETRGHLDTSRAEGQTRRHLDTPPEVDEDALAEQWSAAAREAARDRFRPAGVTSLVHGPAVPAAGGTGGPAVSRTLEDDETAPPPKPREGRFGATFGTTVHRALELRLSGRAPDTASAVDRARAETGLAEHVAEAREDVDRTVDTLRAKGLLDRDDVVLRLEYPVAAPSEAGLLVRGYVDLLAATPDELYVIDFKTDQPPADGEPPPPHYVEQLRAYAGMLEPVAGERAVRGALLFTGDGGMRGREPQELWDPTSPSRCP